MDDMFPLPDLTGERLANESSLGCRRPVPGEFLL